MKLLMMVILTAALVAGCSLPPNMAPLGKGDTSMSGTCDIDHAGWEITYTKKTDRTTFLFWVEGGSCKTDN